MLIEHLKTKWDYLPSFKKGCLLNFVYGARSCGKSYQMKRWAIDSFLNDKSKFVYIRRTVSEHKFDATFFNDIDYKYGIHVDFKNDCYYIEGELFGYSVTLSNSDKLKSSSFDGVNVIFFDEFLLLPGSRRHYLPQEVNKFFELYITICRGRDVPVYFLANAVASVNPFFDYFKIKPPNKTGIYVVSDDILVEDVDPKYSKENAESRIGKLITNNQYSDYAFGNEFLLDNYGLVNKKGRSRNLFGLQLDNKMYSVWHSLDDGLIYISQSKNTNTVKIYSDDFSTNYIPFNKYSPPYVFLMDNYKLMRLRFESLQIKETFISYLERGQLYG